MKRSFTLLTLAALSFTLSLSGVALSGGHSHSNGPKKLNSDDKFCPQAIVQKVLTGTRNGVGFIADPKPRSLKPQTNDPNVTKITDPIPPGKLSPKSQITETSLIALPISTPAGGSGGGAGPVVRDHTLVHPTRGREPAHQRDTGAITTGDGSIGIGEGVFILQPVVAWWTVDDFKAPRPRGVASDNRTGQEQITEPFQVNTQGPANRRP